MKASFVCALPRVSKGTKVCRIVGITLNLKGVHSAHLSMHLRARAGSYDYEEGLAPPPRRSMEDDNEVGKGHRRVRRSRNGVFVAVSLALIVLALCLASVAVFKSSRASPQPALPRSGTLSSLASNYVKRVAHELEARRLRLRLNELFRRTQIRVRHRRESRGPPRLEENLPEISRQPLYRGPKSGAEDLFVRAETSDAALDVLERRVAAAGREADRQALIDVDRDAREEFDRNTRCDRYLSKPKHSVRLASVNLWQPAMDSWPRRRKALAALLSSLDVDVAALQEVRGAGRGWARELADEMASPFHVRYIPGTGAGTDANGGLPPPGWVEEGVAVLSRFELDQAREQLVGMPPSFFSSDRNPRTTLGVILKSSPLGEIRLVASHLSYDRDQQCLAVREYLKPWLDQLWLADSSARGQIVLGDLNAYPDFEWPFDELLFDSDVLAAIGGPCFDQAENVTASRLRPPPPFVDAWTEVRDDNDPGWTFPNPETMHLDPARPDRILVRSESLRAVNAFVVGCEQLSDDRARLRPTLPSDHRILIVDISTR